MTFESLLVEENKPVVVVTEQGTVESINVAFTEAYGWTTEDLVGKSLTTIIPEDLRDAHQMGFARFLSTNEPAVQNTRIELKVLFADGTVATAYHFITSTQENGRRRFIASIEKK
ncbi:PAS domain S-box protein [Pseudodesulfovibrio sp. JC047]|uniref:PAS domain S-box protein n=1 Tax=Pseudodesulfovibrio sp. JC047 TaxID=2683199 RepID=UPI0013D5FDBC|nr:PAS domain S-box protein [Pseudodesulfovibrio sp. JC047]NDV19249.1 PAS domain S-box protein [Pseudodesulfovibrio sp. JC047]